MSACKPRWLASPGPAGACASLTDALKRLVSLHDGDEAYPEVVAFGPSAIPELRNLLFRRDPSGLHQPRCRVVDTLAALGADEILVEFLAAPHDFADPVENAGCQAVMSAAARALRGIYSEAVFALLLSLAETRRLPGAIEVLARFHRADALPCIVGSLGDDLARPSAEAAIGQFGERAWPHLLQALRTPVADQEAETESSRRRRRAAIDLLIASRGGKTVPPNLRRQLAQDDDSVISVKGCVLAMQYGDASESADAARRLLDLLPEVAWPLRQRIETCLLEHATCCEPLIAARSPRMPPAMGDFTQEADAQRSLLRIAARLGKHRESRRGRDENLPV